MDGREKAADDEVRPADAKEEGEEKEEEEDLDSSSQSESEDDSDFDGLAAFMWGRR